MMAASSRRRMEEATSAVWEQQQLLQTNPKRQRLNILSLIWPLIKGMADSIGGTVAIFTLDRAKNSFAVRKRDKKDMLLRRGESPAPSSAGAGLSKDTSSSTESLAKKRALEKREQTSASRSLVKKDAGKHQQQEQTVRVMEQTVRVSSLNLFAFIVSQFLFYYVFVPFVQLILHLSLGQSQISESVWSVTESTLTRILDVLYIVPLFLLCKILNAIWFQDLADSAFLSSRGRTVKRFTVAAVIADSLWSVAIESVFLCQAYGSSYFPITFIGKCSYFLHLCLLNSMYCFEYKWFSQGFDLAHRIQFIEQNWLYFFAFGVPLTLVTSLGSTTVECGSIFSILFPFFIVAANQAQPVDNPIEYRLPVFKPTTYFMDFVVRVVLGKVSSHKKQPQDLEGSPSNPKLRKRTTIHNRAGWAEDTESL